MRRREWKDFQLHYFHNSAQNTDWLFHAQVFPGCFISVTAIKATIDRILYRMEEHSLYFSAVLRYNWQVSSSLQYPASMVLTSQRKHLFNLQLSTTLLTIHSEDLLILELEGPIQFIISHLIISKTNAGVGRMTPSKHNL